MSKLVYKEQSVVGLEYNLLNSSGININFKVLKNKIIKWQELELEFSIIGSSHYVRINSSELHLIELIACLDLGNLPVINVLEKTRLMAANNYKYCDSFNKEFDYSFYAKTIKDKVGSYQEFINKFREDSYNIYLDYIFPSPAELAITSIEINRQNTQLCWTTYHSYPAEKVIIKTESRLERSER